MANVLADLVDWLRLIGIDLTQDSYLRALSTSNCLKILLAEISPLDCDPQFTSMLARICEHLHGSRASRVKSSGIQRPERSSAA